MIQMPKYVQNAKSNNWLSVYLKEIKSVSFHCYFTFLLLWHLFPLIHNIGSTSSSPHDQSPFQTGKFIASWFTMKNRNYSLVRELTCFTVIMNTVLDDISCHSHLSLSQSRCIRLSVTPISCESRIFGKGVQVDCSNSMHYYIMPGRCSGGTSALVIRDIVEALYT